MAAAERQREPTDVDVAAGGLHSPERDGRDGGGGCAHPEAVNERRLDRVEPFVPSGRGIDSREQRSREERVADAPPAWRGVAPAPTGILRMASLARVARALGGSGGEGCRPHAAPGAGAPVGALATALAPPPAALDAELCSAALNVFIRSVFISLRRRARARFAATPAAPPSPSCNALVTR